MSREAYLRIARSRSCSAALRDDLVELVEQGAAPGDAA
jgi:hypothetical protein